MATTSRYIPTVDVAKRIRAHLKSVYPGIKFSVRSDQYAGGSSIRVRWVDGPRRSDVETHVSQYAGSDFDGMTDMKVIRDPQLVATETGLELVRYGVDFIFCERDYSTDFMAAAAAKVCTLWGVPVPDVVAGYRSARIATDPRVDGEYLSTRIYRHLEREHE